MSAQRIVTLPPSVTGSTAVDYARRARESGAQLLEVRTDLHAAGGIDPRALAGELPLLVSQRGKPVPADWEEAARWIDLDATESALMPRQTPIPPDRLVFSHHASRPLTPEQAESFWRAFGVPAGSHLKHVEPLGDPQEAERLFETRRRLRALATDIHVTVLATGPLALPFRCRLAESNALDYLALGPEWSAAPGQRLLADARREALALERGQSLAGSGRLGILGAGISGSRSPRVHPQPFDRLELPNKAALERLLPALLPHYRGFAVTSPFKKAVAEAVGADIEAVNTLYREGGRYRWANTDIAGARAVLETLVGHSHREQEGGQLLHLPVRVERLERSMPGPAQRERMPPGHAEELERSMPGPAQRERTTPVQAERSAAESKPVPVTVLGDGGSTFALKQAALALGLALSVVTRRELESSERRHVGGAVVWTWPDGIEAPPGLSLEGAKVAIVAYGAAARRIAEHVRRLGGTPLKLGARWFVAQAREQREHWEKAT